MANDRLGLALQSGAVALPEAGAIAVFGPTGQDLGDLPKQRLQLLQGFKPQHDHYAAQGFKVSPTLEGAFSAAVLFMPRARPQARAWVAQALALTNGGPLIIDGQKTDGIDSMLRDCRKRGQVGEVLSKSHGKLFSVQADAADFNDWVAQAKTLDGFTTLPGVFSADGIDKGSALLAQALPDTLKGVVADFGAGWGYLSAQLTTNPNITELHLVEADHDALACARQNVSDPRARFHWADATRWQAPKRLDAVISNPPFHIGRAADPTLGQAFIRAAATALAPSGQLWLVANRHLPYERILTELFRNSTEVTAGPGFKILHATQPISASRRTR